jgi:hypothetical protein
MIISIIAILLVSIFFQGKIKFLDHQSKIKSTFFFFELLLFEEKQ